MTTVRRSARRAGDAALVNGFTVTSLSDSAVLDALIPDSMVVDPTTEFLYKPHSIAVLLVLLAGLVYTAIVREPIPTGFSDLSKHNPSVCMHPFMLP